MAAIVLSAVDRLMSLTKYRAQLAAGFQRVIAQSFEHDRSRVTGAETRRRFEICASLFARLAMDTGWSNGRVIDHLPYYLRCELDGKPWKPPKIGLWSPEALARNQLTR